MLDRAHSLVDTEVQARSAVRMSRNVSLGSCGFLDSDRYFLPGIGTGVQRLPSAAHAAGRKDLDEVGALREISPGVLSHLFLPVRGAQTHSMAMGRRNPDSGD